MKPTTVAELRAAIERDSTQIPRGLLRDVCDCFKLSAVLGPEWTSI